MNWEIQFLLIVTSGVSSFSTYNSTLVTDSNQLFQPIIIPNITKYFEQPQATAGPSKATDPYHEGGIHPQKPTTPSGDHSNEESHLDENSLKFSSRYSTKDLLRDREKTEHTNVGSTEVPEEIVHEPGSLGSEKAGESRSFADRSDDLDSSEEEKEDVREYFDSNEPEESEVAPTTNEPFQDLPRPTSFQNDYQDEDFKNYEITSTLSGEEATEEESKKDDYEEAEKRAVDDYYNSGSKNYHSVQTPLSKIHYRGPHAFQEDVDSDKIRTRLLNPIKRPSTGHKWPYSRSQIKTDLEHSNAISDSEENNLEEGIIKELRGKSAGLELAVEKDEERFGKKKKYNFTKERDSAKQKLKSLAFEEEKDHNSLPFQTLKQYRVDEKLRYQPPKKSSLKPNAGRRVKTTTPKNIFFNKPKQPPKLDISQELSPAFQAHQFLGPVVFSPNVEQQTAKANTNTRVNNPTKESSRNAFAKSLLEREKLDQDNLTKERIQKTIFGSGSADYAIRTFNHLEESEEMYNAILANIQSVFGLRTSKSNGGSSRSSILGLEDSKSLTWSLPKTKRR